MTHRFLLALFLVPFLSTASQPDFLVETPGFQYIFKINGVDGPTLTLVRGQTYTFRINASDVHPFHIESPGVINNDIYLGTITYVVPTNAANYFYNCTVHGDWMRGEILTVPPTPPPPPAIVRFAVGQNLTLVSTSATAAAIVPEYTTNLASTNWFALTVLTNRLTNGALETICGRPTANPVLIRLRTPSL